MEWVPYVYFIRHKSTGLRYVGVRFARGCHPHDLWSEYFTSSKLVHKLIEEFGKDDFQIKVWKKFPNRPDQAVLEEAKFFPMIQKRGNYLNIAYSSGIQDLRVCSKGGKVGGAIVKSKGIGIFAIDKETHLKNARAGGKVGGTKQRDLKIGIHAQSKEERLVLSSRGGKAAIPNSGFKDSARQSDRGRRGGPKNKGFVWITDGNFDRKYTLRDQAELSIDLFLLKHPEFKRGMCRPVHRSTCPYCGAEGVTMTLKRTHFDKCKGKNEENKIDSSFGK